jgi:hypothetical protein
VVAGERRIVRKAAVIACADCYFSYVRCGSLTLPATILRPLLIVDDFMFYFPLRLDDANCRAHVSVCNGWIFLAYNTPARISCSSRGYPYLVRRAMQTSCLRSDFAHHITYASNQVLPDAYCCDRIRALLSRRATDQEASIPSCNKAVRRTRRGTWRLDGSLAFANALERACTAVSGPRASKWGIPYGPETCCGPCRRRECDFLCFFLCQRRAAFLQETGSSGRPSLSPR